MIEDRPKRTLAEVYFDMESERRPYLDRAVENASLTVPSAFGEEGDSSDSSHMPPMSSIGARGVNSLSAALLLAAFPPSVPFFRLAIKPVVKAKILESSGEAASEVEQELDMGLSLYEVEVQSEIERRGYRSPLGKAMKQLLVSGNVLLYAPKSARMRVYKLDSFGRRNYPDGEVRSVVISELVTGEMVSDAARAASQPVDEQRDLWAMHTGIEWPRGEGRVTVTQEIAGEEVSVVTYAKKDCPYIPVAWSLEPDEDYGRSFVEDYIGELATTDSLTEALTHGSIAAAEMRVLVDPTGVTEQKALESENLSVGPGRQEDVAVIQAQKFADFSVAERVAEKNKSILAQIFLMADGMVRKAERVTAEEIRMLQEQLNRPLGGAFSELAHQLQKPLVALVLSRLEQQKAIPSLGEDFIDLAITTGMEAMSRGLEGERLKAFLAEIASLGLNFVAPYLKVGGIISELAASRQIDRNTVLRTDAEVEAMRQAAEEERARTAVVDATAPALGQVAADSLVGSGQGEQQ